MRLLTDGDTNAALVRTDISDLYAVFCLIIYPQADPNNSSPDDAASLEPFHISVEASPDPEFSDLVVPVFECPLDADLVLKIMCSNLGLDKYRGVQAAVVPMRPSDALSRVRTGVSSDASLLCFRKNFANAARIVHTTSPPELVTKICGMRWASQLHEGGVDV